MFVIITPRSFFILYFDFETKLFILNLVTTKHLLHQKACANRHEG